MGAMERVQHNDSLATLKSHERAVTAEFINQALAEVAA